MNEHKLRHLDLFSGIGGFSLGLEATGGFETVAFCDIEEYPRKVLAKHWPRVKQYTDIKELTYDKLKSDGLVSSTEKIDIITGGYPCQPFSVAGRKKGEKDPRHLWPEYFRLVQELKPTWVIGENVSGHLKLGLDTVLENLESEGYATRTFSISASSVGANHQRERIFIVANSPVEGSQGLGGQSNMEGKSSDELATGSKQGREQDVADAERIGQQGQGKPVGPSVQRRIKIGETSWTDDGSEGTQGWWDIEPDVGRVAHGVPKRVDRLKCLGNSLIPHIPYYIGCSILESYYVADANGEKSLDAKETRDDGEDGEKSPY